MDADFLADAYAILELDNYRVTDVWAHSEDWESFPQDLLDQKREGPRMCWGAVRHEGGVPKGTVELHGLEYPYEDAALTRKIQVWREGESLKHKVLS